MAKAEGKKRIVVKVGTSTLTHKTGKIVVGKALYEGKISLRELSRYL